MKAESLARLIGRANRLESELAVLSDKLHEFVEQSTQEEIEEQVRKVGKANRDLEELLVKLGVTRWF